MTRYVIAGAPVTVGMLLVCTLVVAVVAAVGVARGWGIRPALWTGLVMSVAVIGIITLGSAVTGEFGGQSGISMVPFQEIQRGLDHRGSRARINLVGNIALFVPLGFTIAFLVRNGFWARLGLAGISGLVLSCAIEVTQYSFGRIADIDDVILNTSGALVGGLMGALVAMSVARTTRRRALTPSRARS